ncbi:MAG TPA: hypothetical protein VEF35_08375 [Candidatus Bathyarchaeia archaeon]|nr:hypothetical protein [Candidatus Bathyarchaeia archaeon]
MAKGTIVTNVKDALAVGSNIMESATNEIVWLLPPELLVFSVHFGLPEKSKTLIEKGGRVRGVFHISPPFIELARVLLDIGENLRNVEHYEGVFFLVADKKQSISSMHLHTEDLALDDEIVAFWSEDPNYADYLLSNFEPAWKRGVDAQERIRELLELR